MSDKKGTSFANALMYIIMCVVLGYVISIILSMLLGEHTVSFEYVGEYLWASNTQLFFMLIEAVALILGLVNFVMGGGKEKVKMKGKENLENQHFMTDAELEKAFKGIEFSEYKNKPSMFITDPKGEIYAHHSQKLVDNGYNVLLLDLVDPYNSLQWNPLEFIYKNWQKQLHLEQGILKHLNDPLSKYNLMKVGDVNDSEWFEFSGKAFSNLRDTLVEVEVEKAKIKDDCFEDLKDICGAICPTTNEKESSWEDGARDYYMAIFIAMLEDSENEKLGMTIDKFNFYNAYKIAMNKENDFEYIKQYFNGRSPISKTRQLTVHITQSQAKTTRDGYMSTLSNKLSMFADNGICLLTAKNELKFDEFDDRPTAFFIKIPDERATRYSLASVCISQSYKEFVRKARFNEASNADKMAHLKRPMFYILDEFANMPKVGQLDKMITVGRSRWIYLNMAIQSYAQLDNVYGKETSAIVRGQCKATLFYGTPDLETRKQFSEELGNYTIEVDSKNSGSKDKDGNKSGESTSTSFQSRPLVYASDLDKIPLGENITKIFQYFPIRAEVTPAFKLNGNPINALGNVYKYGQMQRPFIPGRRLNEQVIFYDIRRRNNIVLGV